MQSEVHIGNSVKMALIKRRKDRKWLQAKLGIAHRQQVDRLASEKTTKLTTVEELANVFEMTPSEFIALGEE